MALQGIAELRSVPGIKMSNVSPSELKDVGGKQKKQDRVLTVMLPEIVMNILPDDVWCKILSLSVSKPGLHASSDQFELLAEQSRLLELRLVCKGFDKLCTAEHSLLLRACIPGSVYHQPHLLHSMQSYLRRHSSRFEQFLGFCSSACAVEALDAMSCSKLKIALLCNTSQAVLTRLSCFSSLTACTICLPNRAADNMPPPVLDLAALKGLSDLQDLSLQGRIFVKFEAPKQLTSLSITSSTVVTTPTCMCTAALRKLHMTDSIIQGFLLSESLQTLKWADCQHHGVSLASVYCVSISEYMELVKSPEMTLKNLVELSFKTDTSSWFALSWILQLTNLRSLQLAVQSELVITGDLSLLLNLTEISFETNSLGCVPFSLTLQVNWALMHKLCNISFGRGSYQFGPEITSIATLGHLVCMSVFCMIPANSTSVRHFAHSVRTLARERPTVRVLIDGCTFLAVNERLPTELRI